MSEQYIKFQTPSEVWNILEAPNETHEQHLPVDGPFKTEEKADEILALWNNGERVKYVCYKD